MELKIGDEVEFVKYDKKRSTKTSEKESGLKIGMKLKIVDLKYGMYLVDYEDKYVYNYQIKHIAKPKKKPYWIEVNTDRIYLCGRNNFVMRTPHFYDETGEANQMAKRLAKNLGLEFRQ
jgi:hypothetical protein